MMTAKVLDVAYDGILTIATAKSRKSTAWANHSVSWSSLLKKLSITYKTRETQAEYSAMPKTKQDEIKDVGGFVGGVLNGGHRNATSVSKRQLVVLDADYATAEFWDTVQLLTGFACCIYSTHKHRPGHPRYRLVIPLSEAVGPDKYQALARKIADMIGIDLFDDTTYQAHRLMYWPSTSKDGEYVFEYRDSPWLDPEKVLAEYEDWTDQSTWPVSSRQAQQVAHELKKQADPLEKAGPVGTFCRAYTISEAIDTFLPDTYEECAGGDRYTYKAGSTTGGAVVYEDKFLYSHHSTDPCSGQLVNAFDLVRLHKFHELDDEAEAKNGKDLPSFKAMCDFVNNDEKTSALLLQETEAKVEELFEDLGDEVKEPQETGEEDQQWSQKLKKHPKTGVLLPTRENIRLLLRHSKVFKGLLGWDAFAQRIAKRHKAKWEEGSEVMNIYWTDADDTQLRYIMETVYGIDSRPKIDDEILSVAHMNEFHPVRAFLKGLQWDGVPRAETLFIDYLGAEDMPYTRTVTRKMLAAAVARVMHPGCKFDNMVVLKGGQGIGKSLLLKKLGGEWFSESQTFQGKEAFEQLRGAWIIEAGELAAMKKMDVEPIKQFISKSVDRYRVAYGKRIEEFPRQCIFVGTTNDDNFLRDHTGNRRFWPVECEVQEKKRDIKDEGTEEYLKQVWAEAVVLYKKGEKLYLEGDMELRAREIQETYTEENNYVGMLEEFLSKRLPKDWYDRDIYARRTFFRGGMEFDETDSIQRNKVCLTEIFVEMLDGDLKNFDYRTKKDLTDAMNKQEGWKKSSSRRFGAAYGNQKCWIKVVGGSQK